MLEGLAKKDARSPKLTWFYRTLTGCWGLITLVLVLAALASVNHVPRVVPSDSPRADLAVAALFPVSSGFLVVGYLTRSRVASSAGAAIVAGAYAIHLAWG